MGYLVFDVILECGNQMTSKMVEYYNTYDLHFTYNMWVT